MTEPTNQMQGPGRAHLEEASKITRSITWVSVFVAFVLTLVKLIAYILSGSVSVLASFADSALDFVASITAFIAVRYASEPADKEHRFGHGKAESFASLFQALLVAVTAALVAREAVARLIAPTPLQHSAIAIAVIAFSIILTLVLVWLQTRALARSGSIAVAGDRAHYQADLVANVSVIIGLVMTAYGGLGFVDALIGLVLAFWLVRTAWIVAKGALDQMMDRELPETERQLIREIALSVDGVYSIHELRTRASGLYVHMQFHLDLDPDMPLFEAHKIVVEVERKLLLTWPAADILVHPDPKGKAEPHGLGHFRGEAGTP